MRFCSFLSILSVLGSVALLPGCSGGDPSLRSAERGTQERTAERPTSVERTTSSDNARSSARVVLEPPGQEPVTVRVEVARTPSETQRGLMFRRQMDADAGMLFLFPRPRQMTFWMRNTFLPLDMIFITSDRRVLGVVENATPQTDDPREVPGISQFVLEVNAGFARQHAIGPGTLVRFEGVENVPTAPAAGGAEVDDSEFEEFE